MTTLDLIAFEGVRCRCGLQPTPLEFVRRSFVTDFNAIHPLCGERCELVWRELTDAEQRQAAQEFPPTQETPP